jgi:hypothetical protein
MSEQTPSPAEVQQYEEPSMATVPVRVDGPVRVAELPSVTQGIGSVVLDTTGSQVLAADPRRKRATLLTNDQEMHISHSQAGLVNGATWPVDVPLILDTSDALWARAAADTTQVTVIIEGWAE